MAKSHAGIRRWKSFRERAEGLLSGPDEAYPMLFRLIIDQRLTGPIVESRLCRSLDVSRTDLRRALIRLEREGFVRRGDNTNFVVRGVGLKEFRQAFAIRDTLESEAAALAAGRIPSEAIAVMRQDLETYWTPFSSSEVFWRLDDALHELAADHCRNPVLADAIRSVRQSTRLFGRSRHGESFPLRRALPTNDEHLEILDALERGSAARARKAMQAHTRKACRFKESG